MLPKLFLSVRKLITSALGDTKSMLVAAIVVFAIGALASYVVANTVSQREAARYENTVANAHDNFTSHIHTRVASYQTLLRGGAGLINLKDRPQLTATAWRHYVEILRSENNLQDLQGIGFSEFIDEDGLESYRQKMEREHGFPISLDPKEPRDIYTSISYLEPIDPENRRAIGYDMFADPSRNRAMVLARDSGKTALTAPVISVQDLGKENPSKSILAYFPVYGSQVIPNDTYERRASIIGYSYLVFRASDLLAEYRTATNNGESYMDIVDVTDSESQPTIYRTEGFDATDTYVVSEVVDVGERKWQISLYIDQPNRSTASGLGWPLYVGLLLSLSIASLLYLMLRHRNKLIEEAHERELNRARNDLVALASHQLRTPATGTRQYIGMLIEGYFGDLSDEQADVAVRAYDANERQLEIVDEILYVAKAESGQIFLSYSELDIIKRLHDIVADNHDDAKKKDIDIKFISRSKKLFIEADAKYITMALENLLDNAIKYSYPGGTVTIRLTKSRPGSVQISFIDQGVGIATEDQPQLFEKFVRIDNPLSSTEGGSGLGLYLAEKLIRAHGGSISVDSEAGEGSAFTISLPIRNNRSRNVVQLTE